MWNKKKLWEHDVMDVAQNHKFPHITLGVYLDNAW